MRKDMDSQKFVNQAKKVYQNAIDAAAELLRNNGENRYVACPDFEDEVSAHSLNDVPINIWGVGLNEKNHICIKASVANVGYGFVEEDFPQEWTDITEENIYPTAYPDLYRFVADHIDAAINQETAAGIEIDEDTDEDDD
jgi:hypothetical protein